MYMLTDADFERLLLMIDRDPRNGYSGGSSSVLSEAEAMQHHDAHRFFNYQIRTWLDSVKK